MNQDFLENITYHFNLAHDYTNVVRTANGLEDHDQNTASLLDLSESICTNLPVPPTLNSQSSDISQTSKTIYYYVLLVKILKDLINVTASGTEMKYMRIGAVNSK